MLGQFYKEGEMSETNQNDQNLSFSYFNDLFYSWTKKNRHPLYLLDLNYRKAVNELNSIIQYVDIQLANTTFKDEVKKYNFIKKNIKEYISSNKQDLKKLIDAFEWDTELKFYTPDINPNVIEALYKIQILAIKFNHKATYDSANKIIILGIIVLALLAMPMTITTALSLFSIVSTKALLIVIMSTTAAMFISVFATKMIHKQIKKNQLENAIRTKIVKKIQSNIDKHTQKLFENKDVVDYCMKTINSHHDSYGKESYKQLTLYFNEKYNDPLSEMNELITQLSELIEFDKNKLVNFKSFNSVNQAMELHLHAKSARNNMRINNNKNNYLPIENTYQSQINTIEQGKNFEFKINTHSKLLPIRSTPITPFTSKTPLVSKTPFSELFNEIDKDIENVHKRYK